VRRGHCSVENKWRFFASPFKLRLSHVMMFNFRVLVRFLSFVLPPTTASSIDLPGFNENNYGRDMRGCAQCVWIINSESKMVRRIYFYQTKPLCAHPYQSPRLLFVEVDAGEIVSGEYTGKPSHPLANPTATRRTA
jgi:hypothetical protein